MTRSTRNWLHSLVATTCLALPALANAQPAGPSIYEGFEYPVGPSFGQGGGTNLSGTWTINHYPVVSGSLTYQNLQTTGNHIAETWTGYFYPTTSRRYDPATYTSLASGGEFWFSCLFNVDSNHFYSYLVLHPIGTIGLQLRNDGLLFIGGPYFKFGAFTTSQTSLLVGRITCTGPTNDGANDLLELWTNTTPGLSSPGAPPAISLPLAFEVTPDAGFRITTQFGPGTLSVDEIRLGPTYASVTPIVIPDTDGDGLLDVDEVSLGTDPGNSDTDGDGLLDGAEVHTTGTDPLDADSDDDGLADGLEISIQQFGCPDPLVADTDRDGLSDGYEEFHGLDVCDDADFDGDGLMDAQEVLDFGTNPMDSDTDDDGLFDGTEVDMAQGGGCPSPLVADSDGDSLPDGTEVDPSLGTDPCNVDTDADSVADNVDDMPTVPGVSSGFIESDLRVLCEYVNGLPLDAFDAPNDNARRGRRNAMCNKLNAAAKSVSKGEWQDAYDQLQSLLQKLDDEETPPDWMVHVGVSPTSKDTVRDDVALMAYLIAFWI